MPETLRDVTLVPEALHPELVEVEGNPTLLDVTDQYSDQYYIGTVAKFLPLKAGIDTDIEKVTFRHFEDADGGEGTLIRCHE